MRIEEVRRIRKHTRILQTRHGHQYPEEEEYGRHIDMLHHLGHTIFDRLLDTPLAVIDDLGTYPQHAERDHHAHIGRKSRKALEYRHEEQAQNTAYKHAAAETRPDALGECIRRHGIGHMRHMALDHTRGERRRYYERHKTRQQQITREGSGRDVAAHPEHDCRDVAYGRPCAAAVGRDDDHAGEDPAFVTVAYQTSQHHHHDDRCRHVIQHGRHEEGNEGQKPHQTPLLTCGNVVGDDGEASMHVDQIDDGHGADKEYERLARIAQIRYEFAFDIGIAREDAQHGPDYSAHEQCEGRLVNLDFVFQRYTHIAQNKDKYNACYHNR